MSAWAGSDTVRDFSDDEADDAAPDDAPSDDARSEDAFSGVPPAVAAFSCESGAPDRRVPAGGFVRGGGGRVGRGVAPEVFVRAPAPGDTP
ncbi:hypothetical protein, partial [Streptomyces sp. NPDC059398]|uniref:hypothetical protein n=1 Tax=Streptomyces sp. NPDC059398 TaxID=3346820 RepID=UPI0036B6C8D6